MYSLALMHVLQSQKLSREELHFWMWKGNFKFCVVMDFEDAGLISCHAMVVMHAIHYLISHCFPPTVFKFLHFIYFGSSFHVASFQFEGETA